MASHPEPGAAAAPPCRRPPGRSRRPGGPALAAGFVLLGSARCREAPGRPAPQPAATRPPGAAAAVPAALAWPAVLAAPDVAAPPEWLTAPEVDAGPPLTLPVVPLPPPWRPPAAAQPQVRACPLQLRALIAGEAADDPEALAVVALDGVTQALHVGALVYVGAVGLRVVAITPNSLILRQGDRAISCRLATTKG